ncbi:MAG: FG-GAP repeat domain-containing protein [Candidatus Kapaibacterium sp.]
MYRGTFHITRLLPLIGVLLFTSISLEAQNEIVQNPDAVLLRKVWMVRGGVVGGDRVGDGAGGVGFINSDSIADFAWYLGASNLWNIHLGGEKPSTTPYQILDSLGTIPSHPIVGDFFGTGEKWVGFSGFFRVDRSGPRTKLFMRYRLLPIKGDTLSLESSMLLAPEVTWRPGLETTHDFAAAIDLDKDGDDELIIVTAVTLIDPTVDRRAEVWIFEGGPNFQLDTPSVVLKDTEENDNSFHTTIGDLDGDKLPDIICSGNYRTAPTTRLNIWWGKQALNDLSTEPDRMIDLDQTLLSEKPSFVDLDGDHVLDVVGNRLVDVAKGTWEISYFSSKSASAHTRRFDREDAQSIYLTENLFAEGSLGYINDSLRRYETLALYGPSKTGGVGLYGLSGGKNGPNETVDMIYSASGDGMTSGNIFGVGGPVGDATGNGWSDYLTANPSWFGGDQGIVILLEGGPYIPTDDTTSGVQEVATDEHRAALHIWPNPVVDEMHVAWRGDLKSSPSFLRIYDMAGRLIVEQDVDGWRGEALWKCGAVASGSYLLVVYDHNEHAIAQTNIIKDE